MAVQEEVAPSLPMWRGARIQMHNTPLLFANKYAYPTTVTSRDQWDIGLTFAGYSSKNAKPRNRKVPGLFRFRRSTDQCSFVLTISMASSISLF